MTQYKKTAKIVEFSYGLRKAWIAVLLGTADALPIYMIIFYFSCEKGIAIFVRLCYNIGGAFKKYVDGGIMDGYRLYSSLDTAEFVQKYARVDLSALRSNYRILRGTLIARAPSLRTVAVVKADAYGHGAEACVRALLQEGCDFFAVSCIEEAIAVRRACATADILILGYTEPRAAELLAEHALIQTVTSASYAERLDEAARGIGTCVRVHAAINTGMNRIGLNAREHEEIFSAAEELLHIGALASLDLCGMFTHFSNADEETPLGEELTARQLSRYRALRAEIERRGLFIPFHHVCNSAAAVRGVAELFDGARLGILLYGACPSLSGELKLSPVMRLCARIVHVFRLPAGERVGYGGEFLSDREREVAVIGIGYADGWLRAYAGANVRITTPSGAHDVPLIGRICMDQCMLDVTGIGARVGDTVTLFGDGREQLAALSARAGSIDYESLCLVSSRVPRFYENF